MISRNRRKRKSKRKRVTESDQDVGVLQEDGTLTTFGKSMAHRLQRPLIMLALLHALHGCASFVSSIETPSVNLVSVNMLQAGLFEQRFEITLRVQNPNPIDLPITGIDYEIKLAGDRFGRGVTPQRISVPANDESIVRMELSTNLIDAIRTLADWLDDSPENLPYEISGNIHVDLPLIGSIPFSEGGNIRLSRR